MKGMSRQDGKALTGIAHLRQSLTDILTTPIGTRVMRRDYGSRLFELIDAPLNDATIAEIYVATAEAIERWEPRFKLLQVAVTDIRAGHVTLDLAGEYLPQGRPVTLRGLVL
ncbi:GPW/gp25 family protein [Grimontia sp. SpTr1]|uniref:GPW/gp25 family protein n=1 Tax=Grimontia sp. SpTr1 TaxID=2995319 RepID=UPI00248BB2CD|nr:GPW/gp25 family protein [Grimontia sp. SpTr1]